MKLLHLSAAALVVLLSAAFTPSAWSQAATGQIFGTVTDPGGSLAAGVKVTLTSAAQQQPKAVVTDSGGAYQFPSLPVGVYAARFELPGYRTLVRENIRIEIGFNAEINAKLELATVNQTVDITAQAPVVDTQNTSQSSQLDLERLQELPSGRGEFNIVEQSPGVTGPTKDVGGATNGQQTSFVSRGGDGNQTRFYMDGVDLGPAGSNTAFFMDFDSIAEMAITSGGADTTQESSGLTVNMVSKSGGDTFHGSAHGYFEDQALESNNLKDPALRSTLTNNTSSAGNPLLNFKDFGVEAGGPIKKRKLWFWADYSQQIVTLGDDKVYSTTSNCTAVAANPLGFDWPTVRACTNPDPAYIKHFAYKLTWSPFHNNSFAFENRYDVKEQQHFQFGPLRAIESSNVLVSPYDSLSRGPRYWDAGWPAFWRFYDQQVISDRWVVDFAMMHFVKNNEQNLQSDALKNVQVKFEQSTQQFAASLAYVQAYQPMNTFKTTSNYFIPHKWGGTHTIKAGFDYARYENYETQNYGAQSEAIFNSGVNPAFSVPLAVNFYRPSIFDAFLYQTSAWIQDTFTHGRFTLNFGVRFDRQTDYDRPETVPASAYQGQLDANGHPFDYLPAVNYAGHDGGVAWNNFAPRLGATYDVTGKGKTVLKASYDQYYDMRYAGLLAGTYNTITTLSPNAAPVNSFVQLKWIADTNHDGIAQMNEVDTTVLRTVGGQYNKNDHAGLNGSPNSVDPHVSAPRTNEITAGVNQDLGHGFGVGFTYLYRYYDRFLWNRVNGISSSDYTAATFTPAANACPTRSAPLQSTECAPVTYYQPNFSLPTTYTLANEPDYHRTYQGFEFTGRKLMTRWLFTGALTLQSTRQFWTAPDAYQDPTNIAQQNGAQYAPLVGGAGGGYSILTAVNARWIARLGGEYRLPWWGLAVSAQSDFRQGYPILNTINVASRANLAPAVAVLIHPPATQRFNDLHTVDFRLAKSQKLFEKRLTLEPAMDIYNIFNDNTILAAQPNQNASNANYIGNVLGPRVVRFGILATF